MENNGKGGRAALLDRPEIETPGLNGTHKKGKGAGEVTDRTQPMRISMLLVGTAPGMLLDPMNDETLDNLRTKAKVQTDTTRTREQIAATKLYRGDDEQLVIPAANLLAALNHAGKLVAFDAKRKMASSDSSWIPSFLSIETEHLPLLVNGQPASPEAGVHWVADQRRGVLEANRVAVAIVRPKFKVWELPVTAIFDPSGLPTMPTIETVQTLFQLAGRVSGLGSFRPERKGPFGKFSVTNWSAEPYEG